MAQLKLNEQSFIYKWQYSMTHTTLNLIYGIALNVHICGIIKMWENKKKQQHSIRSSCSMSYKYV